MGQFAFLIPLVAAGGAAAYTTKEAAEVESASLRLQAQQEQDAGRDREIERRRALLRALATRSAIAGAQGIKFEGGVAALAKEDIRDARRDSLIDNVNTARRRNSLTNAARNASAVGQNRAVTSLLDTASNAAQML